LAHEFGPGGYRTTTLLGWPDTLQGEIVHDVKDIVLLQLNGYELAPKNIDKVFHHWCDDGLIHVLIRWWRLRERDFPRVRSVDGLHLSEPSTEPPPRPRATRCGWTSVHSGQP
jgi:hypothetical protein